MRRPGRRRRSPPPPASLANLGSSPSITVYAADGTGTLTTPTSVVSASQTGRTITFTYTAATGGINNGSVTLVVPAGWSAPSTTGANAGYTTASSGTVSVASQTITVSSLTIAGGSTFTITYGDTGGGGPGATATSSTGAQTWQAQEKSTSAGSLANLGSSPSITVYAADGSGTLTTPTTNVSASQTGRTITFTYTAATGGINNGSVTLVVPAGWSAPSTTGANAGYSTSSAGHTRRRRTDDHRLLTHARGRLDIHDHLRLDGRRRTWRDRDLVNGRANVAGTGEVHLRRLPRKPRRLAEHHRQRGRRLRNADHTDDERLCVPDRPHDHLHLHRCDGRNQQRDGHAGRPERLDRSEHYE